MKVVAQSVQNWMALRQSRKLELSCMTRMSANKVCALGEFGPGDHSIFLQISEKGKGKKNKNCSIFSMLAKVFLAFWDRFFTTLQMRMLHFRYSLVIKPGYQF